MLTVRQHCRDRITHKLSSVDATMEGKSLNGAPTHVQHVRRNVDVMDFKASPIRWDQDTARAAGQLQDGGAALAAATLNMCLSDPGTARQWNSAVGQ
jgi:hypothetical protein